MDKFDQLKLEYDKLDKINAKQNIFSDLEDGESEEHYIRFGIHHMLISGFSLAVPKILNMRIDFQKNLLRAIIGLREFLEEPLEKQKKLKLSEYIDPVFITVALMFFIKANSDDEKDVDIEIDKLVESIIMVSVNLDINTI